LQLLLALASAVIFGSESRRTRGHILLSSICIFESRTELTSCGPNINHQVEQLIVLLFSVAKKTCDNLRATPRFIPEYSLPRKRVSASRSNGNLSLYLVVAHQRTPGSGSTIPAFRHHVTIVSLYFLYSRHSNVHITYYPT
jgi:hypothetical protein